MAVELLNIIIYLGGGGLKIYCGSDKQFRSWQKLKGVVPEETTNLHEDLRLQRRDSRRQRKSKAETCNHFQTERLNAIQELQQMLQD